MAGVPISNKKELRSRMLAFKEPKLALGRVRGARKDSLISTTPQGDIQAHSDEDTQLIHLQGGFFTINKDRQEISIKNNNSPDEDVTLTFKSQKEYLDWISTLLVWTYLLPRGVSNKWYIHRYETINENKIKGKSVGPGVGITGNESNLLVCDLKILGHLPSRHKNALSVTAVGECLSPLDENLDESWFNALGVLKSNGVLDLIDKLDGSLIYSINVGHLLRSEIRETHRSLFNDPNILFLGYLPILRSQYEQSGSHFCFGPNLPFISNNDSNSNSSRVFLRFPYHIDLEDWFVSLSSLAYGEYYTNTPLSLSTSMKFYDSITIDISEARLSLTNAISQSQSQSQSTTTSQQNPISLVYIEIYIWNTLYARTAIVDAVDEPFWGESFNFNRVPICTKEICLKLKSINNNNNGHNIGKVTYGANDITIADMVLKRADFAILEKKDEWKQMRITQQYQLWKNSKYDIESSSSTAIQNNNLKPTVNLNISIHNQNYKILKSEDYHALELSLKETPCDEIVKRFNNVMNSSSTNSNNTVVNERDMELLLDVFSSLGKEHEWIKSLIKYEVTKLKSTIESSSTDTTTISGIDLTPVTSTIKVPNFYTTLFRGNTTMSKSLDIYNRRYGQEYLESVIGPFVQKVVNDQLDCEIDPSRISTLSNKLDDLTLNKIIEINGLKLLQYVNDLWHNIQATSQDFPLTIKTILKTLRKELETIPPLKIITTSNTNIIKDGTSNEKTIYNCLTGFIFLRLFCPAILNPKLFNLTVGHQTGKIKRTLTLIAKILLGFGNRTQFGAKEPWMIPMNQFLIDNDDQLIDYLDRISGAKIDSGEALLSLSSGVDRPELNINSELIQDLPMNNLLIDKYACFTRFSNLLSGQNLQYLSSKSTSFQSLQLLNNNQNNNQNQNPNTSSDNLSTLSFGLSAETKKYLDSPLSSPEELTEENENENENKNGDFIIEAKKINNKIYNYYRSLTRSQLLTDFNPIGKNEKNWEKFIDQILNDSFIDDKGKVVFSKKTLMEEILNENDRKNKKHSRIPLRSFLTKKK